MEFDSIDWLQSIYLKRQKANSRYSLRAFARQVGVAPGPFSELLSRKRPLTWKTALKIADRMALSSSERKAFLSRVSVECNGVPLSTRQPRQTRELGEDAFLLVSDWAHYALLSLMETKGFRSDPPWVAKRLGVDPVEVRQIVRRLVRLGLLEERGGKWVAMQDWVTTSHDVPSGALKKAHLEMLQRASAALLDVDVEDRDITYVTMAVDRDKLPLAKVLIKQFRRTLVELLESGNQTEVYNLNIQLFPLSKLSQSNKGDSNV